MFADNRAHLALFLAALAIVPAFAGCVRPPLELLGGRDEPFRPDPEPGEPRFGDGERGAVPPTGAAGACGSPAAREREPDAPDVGYATAADRVLVRWRWNESAVPVNGFRLQRVPPWPEGNGTRLVEPITDPGLARAVLDEEDPALAERLVDAFASEGVTDVASLMDLVRAEPLLAQRLAAMHPAVARILARGYLDTDVDAGTDYAYRIVPLRAGGGGAAGGVLRLDATAGTPTDLPRPVNLTALDTSPTGEHARDRDGDWGAAQANRRMDRLVYLCWDPAYSTGDLAAWITGFDVYRAPAGGAAFTRVNGDVPVQPMPAVLPAGPGNVSYEAFTFYYADKAPSAGDWTYVVTPRDLLGAPRPPDAFPASASAPLTVTAHDYVPPPAPRDLAATVPATHDRVRLTWTADVPADFARFEVYRAPRVNASPPASGCTDPANCWVRTASPTSAEWEDTDPTRESVRWYRVRAVDASGNPSAWAGPVQAILHDVAGPAAPTVVADGGGRQTKVGDGVFVTPPDKVTLEGDADTTRHRLYCRFSADGDEVLVAELEGRVTEVDLSAYYDAPMRVDDATCRALPFDAHGNPGEMTASFRPPAVGVPVLPAAPVILDVETVPHGGGLAARLTWAAAPTHGLVAFRVTRTDLTDGSVRNFTVPDATARAYVDATVSPAATYEFTVTAVTRASGTATSMPRLYRVVDAGERPFVTIPWTHVTHSSGSGTSLAWACTDWCDNGLGEFAVFRSTEASAGFMQITPVWRNEPAYRDASAAWPDAWYVAVQYDPRTGEPVGATPPRRAAAAPAPGPVDWPTRLLAQPFVAKDVACQAPLDTGRPIVFAGGFEVVVSSASANAPYSGTGVLTLDPPGSGPSTVPVTFDGVLVDPQQNACSGRARVDTGTPVPTATYASGVTLRVHALRLAPLSGESTMNATLVLPDRVRYREQGTLARAVPLVNATVDARFDFSLKRDLATIPGHTCASPVLEFPHEALPVTVVPLDAVAAGPDGLAFADACMRYVDTYTGARPLPGTLAADANDGFLRATFTPTSAVTLGADGVHGGFATTRTLSWVASHPSALTLDVKGASVTLAGSRIAGGSTGPGTLELPQHTRVHGGGTTRLQGEFSGLTMDADGALAGAVTLDSDVAWSLPGGFRVERRAWELYTAPVTVDGPLGRHAWVARPGDAHDVGFGAAQPADRDAGLNLRSADLALTWTNCGAPVTLTGPADLHVRRGGVSERYRANVIPAGLTLHGYTTRLDAFDVAFLDNRVAAADARGALTLPHPAGVEIPLVNARFGEDGCVDGAEVPAGDREHTLAYWRVPARFDAVEFRAHPAPVGAWDAMLWTLGGLALPHVARPSDTTAGAMVPLEASWRPDGAFDATRVLADRPDFTFDGFPFLLEDVRLSTVGESPAWTPAATVDAPPAADWSTRGFMDLGGAVLTPYFAGVQGPEGEARPRLLVLAWDDHVGFDRRPRVEKVWVDLDVVELTFEYDALVYAHDPATHRGTFVGFESFNLTPDALVPPLPEESQVLHVDTAAVVEPGTLGVHLGLAAGVAAFRALAESTGRADGDALTPALCETMKGMWAPQLALHNASEYANLTNATWSFFGDERSYNETVDALDAYELTPGKDLPNATAYGGGTMGQLDEWGVYLLRLRGHVVLSSVGPTDYQFEEFSLSTELNLTQEGDERPLLRAEILHVEVNRHGDFLLQGRNVSSTMFAEDLTLDATLRINVEAPSFEGGVTLYRFKLGTVNVTEGSAALGIGHDLYYVGASFEAILEDGPTPVALGGAVLLGRIDPSSPVLRTHFEDLMTRVDEVHEDAGSTRLTGFYLRVYGDFPLYDSGCMFRVSAGGEVALWYWTGGGDHYGGRLRGYLYGTVLCVVSARGDVTLEYSVDAGVERFDGRAWVAGGIGSCEPETWRSWETRWWDDGWCWTAGALVDVRYRGDPGEWTFDHETDAE